MKHTKHTPGPWIYSPAVACVFVEQDRTHCPQICTLPAFTPENAENGRLIAAAPDLLQVAKDYILLCQLHDEEGAVYNAARAAIAKATGRA